MFVNRLGQIEKSLKKTFYACSTPSFNSFREAVLEEKISLEINQSETRIACGGHMYKRIGMK
jgi:hypothetical protein